MTNQTVVHDTFTIDRTYPVPPAQVFAAFADLATKERWFAGSDDWEVKDERTLDFRIGGREHECSGPPGGPLHRFDATYHDIVPDERIVYSYVMALDDVRISVSLTTIELDGAAGANAADGPPGTRLRLTEHGAFFDAADGPALRREGTEELFDALGHLLAPT